MITGSIWSRDRPEIDGLDTSGFEVLFQKKEKKKQAEKKETKAPKFITLIDPKRLMNVGLMMAQTKKLSEEQINARAAPRPYLGYKALNNKDILHIKHCIVRAHCT